MCATIAEPDGVAVKDFVIFVMFWEMFIDKLIELFLDGVCNLFVVRWIESYNFTFSLMFLSRACVFSRSLEL